MSKRNKYIVPSRELLVVIKNKAKPEFWDSHWQNMKVGYFGETTANRYIEISKKYLSERARVLEGGCGLCGKLIALQEAGFKASGVDYAKETVVRVKSDYPELDVQEGDVKSLPYGDGTFDGYWSFGVIEHFWHGYDDILAEAYRVLKPGGILFLTFPGMSKVRKIKASLGCYPKMNKSHSAGQDNKEPEGFYQFVLNPDIVCDNLQKYEFSILECFQHNIKSGLKQELAFIWYCLRLIDRITPFLNKGFFTKSSEKILGPVGGHVSVVVARKRKNVNRIID